MNTILNRMAKVFLMSFLALNAAQASAVTFLSDDRIVQNFSDSGTVLTTPTTAFENWSVNYQTSNIASDRFSGGGTGEGYSDFFYSITESIFDITFSVAVATLIDLQGMLSGYDGSFGSGVARVLLYNGSSTSAPVLFSSSAGGGDFATFSFLDTLDPGDYRLVLRTDITPGGFGTEADWNFSADFTELAVPIPAMGWLMAISVLALVRRRKNH